MGDLPNQNHVQVSKLNSSGPNIMDGKKFNSFINVPFTGVTGNHFKIFQSIFKFIYYAPRAEVETLYGLQKSICSLRPYWPLKMVRNRTIQAMLFTSSQMGKFGTNMQTSRLISRIFSDTKLDMVEKERTSLFSTFLLI